MFPVLILDAREHPRLVELVQAHKTSPPGDVEIRWCTIKGQPDSVGLLLSFQRPMNYECVVLFSLGKQAVLVDQILSTQGCYLQPGQPGDRLRNTYDSPRILIEVPLTGFEEKWEGMFDKVLTRQARQAGLGRQAARRAAESMKAEWRQLGRFRKQ